MSLWVILSVWLGVLGRLGFMRKKSGAEERESKLASGWTVESEPLEAAPEPVVVLEETVNDAVETTADETSQMSSGALVVLGVIGGLYLLYTWVWFSWSSFYAAQNTLIAELSGSFGFVLQQMTFWVAPAAPALWFLAAYVLNRKAPTWRLAMWLLIGAVILVPLPMFGSVWGA